MLEKDQPVVELETDKATIEVPSSVAGRVKDVKIKAGDKVKVGQALLSVDDGASASPRPSAVDSQQSTVDSQKSSVDSSKSTADAEPAPAAPPEPPPVAEPTVAEPTVAEPPVDRQPPRGQNVVDITRGARPPAAPAAPEAPPAPAAPSVRRM